MRLLICTQKVNKNDPILGFFHRWIFEFSKHCEKVIVICLEKGEYDLPGNVQVLSLGKENGASKMKYIYHFYKYIWKYRKDYDNVFVHMNSEYVILGGIYWRLSGKRVGLWYTHKAVNLKLSISEKMVNKIFTASDNSFLLASVKKNVVGHGIDIESFFPKKCSKDQNIFQIITVGRISPIKRYEDIINAIHFLKHFGDEKKKVILKIVGGPLVKSNLYYEYLKKEIVEKNIQDRVIFVGHVSHEQIPEYLSNADLFVHMCKDGGLDKVVLESMACGLPILSNNDSVKEYIPNLYQEILCYNTEIKNDLVRKIQNFMNSSDEQRSEIIKFLRAMVEQEHCVDNLIKRILLIINS